MANEFVTLRDGDERSRSLLPPGQIVQSELETAPCGNAGSFLLPLDMPRSEQMFAGAEPSSHVDYLKHPLYTRYMRLPKGLLAADRVQVLQEVHEGLAAEGASRFLLVSGWAAAEAAIVMRGVARNKKTREGLVEGAANTWQRAYDRVGEVRSAGQETPDHYSLQERIGLALASVALLEGIVSGDVHKGILERVTDKYVQVGIDNTASEVLHSAQGNTTQALFHRGLAYEILAMLGFSDDVSARRFVMPATARNDSGYYSPRLTHDLMLFRQRAGQLKSLVPAEVKRRMSRQDKKRYKALVVDGSIMDAIEAGEPGPMIDLYARVYRGDANQADVRIAHGVSRQLWAMVAQYSSGNTLRVGNRNSFIQFHDSSKVRLGGYAGRAA